MIDLSVVVFAVNEAENVSSVLGEIYAWVHAHGAELVFVDDGSTDDTLSLARQTLAGAQNTTVFGLGTNRGIGGALKAGVASATRPWVTFLPCDGQISPDQLDHLVCRADKGDVDVVFSVYRDRDDGLTRKALSLGVRGLIRLVHGVSPRSDGPYLFKRSLFVPSELSPDSFFLNFEFPIRTAQRAIASDVVTISCKPRRAGHSKSAGLRTIARVARELIGLRLRQRRRRPYRL